MALIRAQDLAIGYDDEVIQRSLTFEVEEGGLFLILGGSGCGKSTLLRTLVGLQEPLAGTLEVGRGGPSGGRPRFGVMFQSGALFGSMSLLDNVLLPLEAWTHEDRETLVEIARSKLALVGLGGHEHKLPGAISGGMRKRAAIARALALDPPLLFLDEPSAGLDPITSSGLDDLILSLSRNHGTTLVIVTHELESIMALGGRCIMLDREAGTIIAAGAPLELSAHSSHPTVQAFFRRGVRSRS